MSKVIGIDLGTTNCVVSFINDKGEVDFVPNKDGKAITPTAIHLGVGDKGIQVLVGEKAKELSKTDPENVLMSFKTLMGSPTVIKEFNMKKITALTASYLMLRYLKQTAEDYLQENVYEAVISVPAYFSEQQIEATKIAAKNAKLDVKRILIEPSAAAFHYGVTSKTQEKVVAVYDLGGGTFDISIISIIGEKSIILGAPQGDNKLGGDDIDREIVNFVLKENGRKKAGIDLMDKLVRLCEDAKIELCDNISMGREGEVVIDGTELGLKPVTLTWSKFKSICDPLVQRTLGCFQKALDEAYLTVDALDEVVLVGGSTKNPYVRECLVQFLNDARFNMTYFDAYSVDPDLAVGLGCGTFIKYLEDNKENYITDVLSKSIGIEDEFGKFQVLLKKGRAIPTHATDVFTNAADNQTKVTCKIYEGESLIASKNTLLGMIDVPLPRGPKNTQEVLVKASISKDGTLGVSVVTALKNNSLSIKRQFNENEDMSWLEEENEDKDVKSFEK